MEVIKKSTSKNWLYFTIWLIVMIIMLMLPDFRPFFWLALPGVCTHFALGMRII